MSVPVLLAEDDDEADDLAVAHAEVPGRDELARQISDWRSATGITCPAAE
jgi:hypothetical protein